MEYTITFKVVMTKKVSQADLEDALIHMVLDLEKHPAAFGGKWVFVKVEKK
jgi:hypothetical protein